MRLLDDVAGVRCQFAIWGAAYTGDVIEPATLTSELRPMDRHLIEVNRLFDRTATALVTVLVDRGDGFGYRRPPAHWALPWVTEWRMRQEMGW